MTCELRELSGVQGEKFADRKESLRVFKSMKRVIESGGFRQKRFVKSGILAGYLVLEIFESLNFFTSSFSIQVNC